MVAKNPTDRTAAMTLPPLTPSPAPATPDRPDRMLARARELEAAFLSEMLSHAGLKESGGPFGGGAGEAQFASFLRQEQARLMVEKGGLGLAETIFRSMEAGQHDSGA
jgi:peptidoglycan hydrolase FlgJ